MDSFNRIVASLKLDRDDALEFLKRVGHPIGFLKKTITQEQFDLLCLELKGYNSYPPANECHKCHKQLDRIGPKYLCRSCGHVFCADCVKVCGYAKAIVYPSVGGPVLCCDCAEKAKQNYEKSSANGRKDFIIGLNNKEIETREKLREKLEVMSRMSSSLDRRFDGAMCYCPAMPDHEIEVRYQHRCSTCDTLYRYKEIKPVYYEDNCSEKSFEYSYEDRYKDKENRIDKIVSKIRKIGYDVSVRHMCEKCYNKEFNKKEKGMSISVLYFKFPDEDSYRANVVSETDCEYLLAFLSGMQSVRGYHDATVWLIDKKDIFIKLLGL